MKLKIKHLNEESLRKKLSSLSHVDFSLFVDDVPTRLEEYSSINILVLQEPNEYFGLHDWAIINRDKFNFILTWSYRVLNNCENARFLPFGHTWFKPEQYKKSHPKTFEIAHLSGKLNKTFGHSLRHSLIEREGEIEIPTKFYTSYGDRYNIESARIGKEEVFGNSQFGIAIENTNHRGYFTEKILDCFLMKTIPIYWGCSNIGDFFREEGVIECKNVDDFIFKINILHDTYYKQLENIIESNYKLALSYVDYEQNIVNQIEEIFEFNKLV